MRWVLCVAMVSALSGALLGGCNKPADDTAKSTDKNPDRFRAETREQINPHSPYAGQWALVSANCNDEKKLWTIEPRRMGIRPDLRFCAFKSIYVKQGEDSDDAVWSAAADCLAEGHESKDFVFFRLNHDLKQMRVTFNDNQPIELVRCLKS